MHPKRIDRLQATRQPCVVDRVVVGQHLHLAVQAPQFGRQARGDPGADIGVDHAVQRSRGPTRQQLALGMPMQRIVPAHLQTVFLQIGLQCVQQGL